MSARTHVPLNVLVLACGGSVGHGVLKTLAMSNLRCRVIGADIAPEKVGLYTVDTAYVSPWAHDPAFMPWLLSTCSAENVDAIIGVAEPVLKVLAAEQERIREETGAVCLVSTPETFNIGDDKLLTSRWLAEQGLDGPSFAAADDPEALASLVSNVGYPLIAKRRVGGGANGLVHVLDEDALSRIAGRADYVVQQSIGSDDDEYTVGCMCDRDGELRGTIVFRRRLQWGSTVFVEAGEFPEIRAAAEAITQALRPRGPINLQFRMHEGRASCFEFQVRFSGTAPVRARFGFNEVEAALLHFVQRKEFPALPQVTAGCMARF